MLLPLFQLASNQAATIIEVIERLIKSKTRMLPLFPILTLRSNIVMYKNYFNALYIFNGLKCNQHLFNGRINF